MKRILGATAVALATFSVPSAQAASIETLGSVSIYRGADLLPAGGDSALAEANFLAALASYQTETFDSAAHLSGGPFAISGVNATLGGDAKVWDVSVDGGPLGAGRFATSGTKFLEAGSDEGTVSTFGMSFSSPIAAFGFFGTDVGDFSGLLQINVVRASGATSTFNVRDTIAPANGGDLIFFGLVESNPADLIKSLLFVTNSIGTQEFFGLDDLTVGQVAPAAVPEPGSLLLLGTGVAALARRRRNRQQS